MNQQEVIRPHAQEGHFHVRVFHPAWADSNRLFRTAKSCFEAKEHALKLRYWPSHSPTTSSGTVIDLNWCWVKSMAGMNVGELRIDDVIGGHDNLRFFFYVGDKEKVDFNSQKPIIWIIRAMQKKSDDLSKHDISTLKSRRLLVNERFYKSYSLLHETV